MHRSFTVPGPGLSATAATVKPRVGLDSPALYEEDVVEVPAEYEVGTKENEGSSSAHSDVTVNAGLGIAFLEDEVKHSPLTAEGSGEMDTLKVPGASTVVLEELIAGEEFDARREKDERRASRALRRISTTATVGEDGSRPVSSAVTEVEDVEDIEAQMAHAHNLSWGLTPSIDQVIEGEKRRKKGMEEMLGRLRAFASSDKITGEANH
ncbi:hypothetical protein EW146_g5547 [Bondarzewia mesenterica]|uniref:Uncharacterized protein n=1 Tax=Bondarzewia mesenterica TaxID=1095465 RepID=A0A4S4LT15_9AGAM|nr:hypothetical protein EW146_g5547 [Bondarzewia mesenterica]